MAGKNLIQNLLRQSFQESDKKMWEDAAISEVEGAQTLEKLKWTDQDGNQFLSYYTRTDILPVQYLDSFIRHADSDTFLGNRTWYNAPVVTVTDEVSANKIALGHLASGADGIVFDLKQKQTPVIASLLQNIDWRYCRLSFSEVEDLKFFDALNEFATENKLNVDQIGGEIFWEKIPQVPVNLPTSSGLFALGIRVNTSTPIQEITEALVTGVKLLQSSARSSENTFRHISFSLPVNTNFLTEIAKFKALRLLWYQIARACQFDHYKPGQLWIQARSEKWIKEQFQPHGNMLKSTTAALAAIAGGCNTLSVFPEDENIPTMSRIARNVSSVLREESHLDKVSDPLAGAYAIEIITDTFAKKAWSQFQTQMKNENA